jgi:hypothetical protein
LGCAIHAFCKIEYSDLARAVRISSRLVGGVPDLSAQVPMMEVLPDGLIDEPNGWFAGSRSARGFGS